MENIYVFADIYDYKYKDVYSYANDYVSNYDVVV